MSLDPHLHRRRSVRLRARDYSSPGHYYLTLCTEDRRLLFGDVVEGMMRLNDLGRAADRFWNEIPRHFPQAALDEYVVMPNHIHGIIRIIDHVDWVSLPMVHAVGIPIVPGICIPGTRVPGMGADVVDVGANDHLPLQHTHSSQRPLTRSPLFPMGHGTSRTIGSMIRGFKIGVTRHARTQGCSDEVWQRNYFDHIIRHERSLERIRAYIRANPANWGRDRQNPER